MGQKISLFFYFFTMATALQAQSPRIKFIEYDLDNGLHVILHQDKSTPILAVSMMYHVGSKNEEPNRTGFAHFFEHLMFEGTKNIGRGEYFNTIQSAGGTLNANTTYDRTFYYEVLPSNQLELGLYMESERLLHANVDSIGIATQRQVIKEERRQRVDNKPYGSVIEEMMERAFTKHPYQWPVIGYTEHLNEASDQEFVDFYNTFYVPNNAVLSIAGDIDIRQTKKWVSKYFAEIPRGAKEIPWPEIVEPEQNGEIRDVVYDNIQLPGVFQGYHVPAQGTDDYYAVRMLTKLLSDGQSSRLYNALVDIQQKAVYAGAFTFSTEDPGVIIIQAIANVGVSIEALEEALNNELYKVKNELISEREYLKLQNQLESHFVSRNARVQGIAESLANYHLYFDDANLINTELKRYQKVTREDIKRVANQYLVKDNRVVLYYLPKSAQNQTGSIKNNKTQ